MAFYKSEKIKAIFLDENLYCYFQNANSVMHTSVDERVRYYSAQKLIEFAKKSSNKKLQKAMSEEGIKSAISYKYHTICEVDRKKIRKNYIELKKKCIDLMKRNNSFSHKEKMKYFILLNCFIVYYIFRIFDEPAMVKWWSVQMKIRKKKLKAK